MKDLEEIKEEKAEVEKSEMSGKHGYGNRSDFILDAIGKRLSELVFLE